MVLLKGLNVLDVVTVPLWYQRHLLARGACITDLYVSRWLADFMVAVPGIF